MLKTEKQMIVKTDTDRQVTDYTDFWLRDRGPMSI